jgi:hypothetical protein
MTILINFKEMGTLVQGFVHRQRSMAIFHRKIFRTMKSKMYKRLPSHMLKFNYAKVEPLTEMDYLYPPFAEVYSYSANPHLAIPLKINITFCDDALILYYQQVHYLNNMYALMQVFNGYRPGGRMLPLVLMDCISDYLAPRVNAHLAPFRFNMDKRFRNKHYLHHCENFNIQSIMSKFAEKDYRLNLITAEQIVFDQQPHGANAIQDKYSIGPKYTPSSHSKMFDRLTANLIAYHSSPIPFNNPIMQDRQMRVVFRRHLTQTSLHGSRIDQGCRTISNYANLMH